ncbi:Signal transduction histidine kinase, phosphotransfer (Hpt) domain containing protein [Parasponia andersonii]|uniref:Histidine-containing phosphotransfer protein n=1 Tax=Parasponia andersonii TaxID=3476 RepID=A0A2P5B8N7_PARAD|nr:Signal transduction histidine kinase, phosphotransfer (Hpt) domain containing protein [Parasponia andersonii]
MLDKHYVTVEKLEGKNNPNFAEEVMTMYFRESTKIIAIIEQALEKPPIDFIGLEKYIDQLKGSSSSIGAKKVRNEVNQMGKCIEEQEEDIERMKTLFKQLKKEHENLRGRIEPYFRLLRQVGPLETAQRPR